MCSTSSDYDATPTEFPLLPHLTLVGQLKLIFPNIFNKSDRTLNHKP